MDASAPSAPVRWSLAVVAVSTALLGLLAGPAAASAPTVEVFVTVPAPPATAPGPIDPVPTDPTPRAPAPLPRTGASTGELLAAAAVLLTLGTVLVRRSTATPRPTSTPGVAHA